MARLRACEIVDGGGKSLLPSAPRAGKLKDLILGVAPFDFIHMVPPDRIPGLEADFKRLRREADAWQAARAAFMVGKLKAGQHPDTHPSFWSGYTEAAPPEIYGASTWKSKALPILALAATALASAFAIRKRRTRRKRRPGRPGVAAST